MKVFILGTGTMGTGISQLMISNPCVSKLYIYSNELDKIKKLLAECNRNLTKLFEKRKNSCRYYRIWNAKSRGYN